MRDLAEGWDGVERRRSGAEPRKGGGHSSLPVSVPTRRERRKRHHLHQLCNRHGKSGHPCRGRAERVLRGTRHAQHSAPSLLDPLDGGRLSPACLRGSFCPSLHFRGERPAALRSWVSAHQGLT